jgi:translocation and assembly module TamB
MSTLSSDAASGKRVGRKPIGPSSPAAPVKRRRWPRRLAIALAGYALLMWVLPILLAWTPLRNRPLAMALPGLNGTITAGGASLGWFSPVVYTDVEIRDPADNLLVSAAAIRTEKTLLQLALSQTDLGTIRIEQPNVALEMRPNGSNAEDVLLPFLNSGGGGGPLTVGLDFVEGTINLYDVAADRKWKIEQFQTSLRLEPKNPVPLECSISGNAIIDQKPAHFSVAYKERGQESLAASQSAAPASGPVEVQAQIEPLPMEMFRTLVARFLPDAQVSGLLSGKLQYSTEPAASNAPGAEPKTVVAGQVRVDGLDLSAAALGGDRLRLAVLQVPCQIAWQGRQIDIQQLAIECDVGRLSVTGATTWPDTAAKRSLANWLRESFTVEGNLDVARLARLLPETLHVRQDIQINSGTVQLALSSAGNSGSHRWTGQLQTSNLMATSAGRPVTWNQPVSINLAAHDTLTGPVVEKLDCQSSFVRLTASGTPDHFTAQADCDLNRLATELGQFVDFGSVKPAGLGQATLDWQRAADNTFLAVAKGQINNLQLAMPGRVWSEAALAATVNAAGSISTNGAARVDKASLDVTTGPSGAAGTDRLFVELLEPVAAATSLAAPGNWHVALGLQGDLARWQARLAPFVSLSGWQLGGGCDASAQVAYSTKGIDIQKAHAVVNRLHAWGGGWFIDEPTMQFDGAASWDSAGRALKLAPSTLSSNTIAIQAKETTLKLPTKGSADLIGSIAWQADLARLGNWMHDPRTAPGSTMAGRFSGQANVSENGALTTAQLAAAIDNLAVSEGATASFWQEKRLTIAAGGKYDHTADALSLDSFDIASTAFRFQGAGKIAKLSGTQDVDLAGQVDYDWQTLGPLLRPYLGAQFQIAGRQSRRFSIHGPLTAAVAPANAADSLAWLRPLVIETGSGWTSANYRGIQFAAAQFDAHLADGTVSLVKPLELGLSEGQVVLSPRLRLSPGPATIMLDKGPLLRQVRLSQEMCNQWLKYVSPLASEAARAQGQFSIDLQGGRIPLDDATRCDIAGQLTIVSADINPGPIIRPFSLIAAQIRAILNGQLPPLAAGSDRPLVHYPAQTVDFRIVNQRVYHERIEMKIGEMTVRTHGSVGLIDESLILEAEVPIRTTPPLIGLGKQSPPQEQVVTIPIEGTLGNPKLDPRAVEKLVAQLLKNAPRNTIRDGIDKIDQGIDKIDNLFRPK